MYIIRRHNYENPELIDSDDVYNTSTAEFLRAKPKDAIKRYEHVVKQTFKNPGPYLTTYDGETGETVFMFGINQGRSSDKKVAHSTFNESLSKLFVTKGITIHKKFIETFSNGVTV